MLYQHINICQDKKDKLWGREFWIVNNQDYCGKVLVLNKQHRCSIHHHKIKKETFFVISGRILLEVRTDPQSDMEKIVMTQGMSMTIVPHMDHRFTGLDPISEIIEFSSQHFEHDSYRDVESGKVPDEEWEAIQNEL